MACDKLKLVAQKQELKNTGDEARRLSRTGTPIMYGQDAIIKLLHDNQETAKEYQETFNNLVLKNPTIASPYTWFVAMTCSEWDYKRNSDWQVPYETFNGENMNNDNRKNWTPWIYFDGMLISADKLGNINLGYIGTKMGFSDIQLKNSYTMDKDDGPYVEYGIKMAEQGR